jgi:hypothetical protein
MICLEFKFITQKNEALGKIIVYDSGKVVKYCYNLELFSMALKE